MASPHPASQPTTYDETADIAQQNAQRGRCSHLDRLLAAWPHLTEDERRRLAEAAVEKAAKAAQRIE